MSHWWINTNWYCSLYLRWLTFWLQRDEEETEVCSHLYKRKTELSYSSPSLTPYHDGRVIPSWCQEKNRFHYQWMLVNKMKNCHFCWYLVDFVLTLHVKRSKAVLASIVRYFRAMLKNQFTIFSYIFPWTAFCTKKKGVLCVSKQEHH